MPRLAERTDSVNTMLGTRQERVASNHHRAVPKMPRQCHVRLRVSVENSRPAWRLIWLTAFICAARRLGPRSSTDGIVFVRIDVEPLYNEAISSKQAKQDMEVSHTPLVGFKSTARRRDWFACWYCDLACPVHAG